MLYGAAVWDPVLIIAQIVTIQCLFYLSQGLLQALFLGPNVPHLTVEDLFSWRAYSLATYVGCVSALSLLASSVLGAIFLMWIVERAKKCLDFATTCFMFHVFFCWSYEGFPARLEWWLVNGVGLIIMSLFGEWLCLRREMQEIPLNTLRGRGASSGPIGPGVGGGGAGGSGPGVSAGGVSSSGTSSSSLQMTGLSISNKSASKQVVATSV